MLLGARTGFTHRGGTRASLRPGAGPRRLKLNVRIHVSLYSVRGNGKRTRIAHVGHDIIRLRWPAPTTPSQIRSLH